MIHEFLCELYANYMLIICEYDIRISFVYNSCPNSCKLNYDTITTHTKNY